MRATCSRKKSKELLHGRGHRARAGGGGRRVHRAPVRLVEAARACRARPARACPAAACRSSPATASRVPAPRPLLLDMGQGGPAPLTPTSITQCRRSGPGARHCALEQRRGRGRHAKTCAARRPPAEPERQSKVGGGPDSSTSAPTTSATSQMARAIRKRASVRRVLARAGAGAAGTRMLLVLGPALGLAPPDLAHAQAQPAAEERQRGPLPGPLLTRLRRRRRWLQRPHQRVSGTSSRRPAAARTPWRRREYSPFGWLEGWGACFFCVGGAAAAPPPLPRAAHQKRAVGAQHAVAAAADAAAGLVKCVEPFHKHHPAAGKLIVSADRGRSSPSAQKPILAPVRGGGLVMPLQTPLRMHFTLYNFLRRFSIISGRKCVVDCTSSAIRLHILCQLSEHSPRSK